MCTFSSVYYVPDGGMTTAVASLQLYTMLLVAYVLSIGDGMYQQSSPSCKGCLGEVCDAPLPYCIARRPTLDIKNVCTNVSVLF